MSIPKPNIQIDDEVREMTNEEFAELIESGWVPDTDKPTD